ncbi:MAG: response regulator transcription factor [Pseudorhodobacter sp.]|nr:response regulator transcription factor [Frankiaceae bacterium]
MRVLLVDDEVRAVAALARGLTAEGMTADVVHDGAAALARVAAHHYDAMVLDIMLPGLSGYEVLKRLRRTDPELPVLVLSAKDGEHDLGDALDLGADDYLVKPYSYVVLVARLRALLRRAREQQATTTTVGDLAIDTAARTVLRAGVPVELSPREFALLAALVRRRGRPVSKSELLERVFEADPDTSANVVEVYVGYLRRKLGREAVVTVRGGGYRVG